MEAEFTGMFEFSIGFDFFGEIFDIVAGQPVENPFDLIRC